MAYTVYMHENRLNGKKYVGQTCKKPEIRWNQGKNYSRSTHFYQAIQKYGWDSFDHIILQTNLTKEEADYWENYYIVFYQTCDRRYGYNLTLGGDGNIGYSPSQEWRKNKSESMKGDKHPFYGTHRSQTTKEKISKANKGSKRTEESKEAMSLHHQKKIVCEETGDIYDSQELAAEAVGLKSSSGISKVCLGKRKTASGYHWRYYIK